jgi:hypothetical protein
MGEPLRPASSGYRMFEVPVLTRGEVVVLVCHWL